MTEQDFIKMEEMMSHMMRHFKGEIVREFDNRIGIMEESFQHKLDLVIEGQQVLIERSGRVETTLKDEIHQIDRRLTVIAADLSAHRCDTEAHRNGWRVGED